MLKSHISCGYPTQDKTPCQNPVAFGSVSCAAGHPIAAGRWSGFNQMVDAESHVSCAPETIDAEALVMTEMTAAGAAELATQAHMAQIDKAGKPYIEHPKRIAAKMVEYYGEDSDEVVVAWLHDVVEDTPVTLERLREFGCTEEQVEAIDALTHRKGESRRDYYDRVKQNLLALRVKFGDIEDNLSEERMAVLDEETQERLRTKYEAALKQLTR